MLYLSRVIRILEALPATNSSFSCIPMTEMGGVLVDRGSWASWKSLLTRMTTFAGNLEAWTRV